MKTFRLLSGFVLTFLLLCAALPLVASPILLVPAGSAWRYMANGTDQGTAWRQGNFNDAAWQIGPAQLGYGDGDEVTVLPPGAVTAYFRHTFQTPLAAPSGLMLRLLRDDGAVVYLNGVEVYRNNMPAGPISYDTLAVTAIGGPEETTQFVTAQIDPSALVQGANVLAVEVHQVSLTSSDLSFDLELTADTGSPLAVVNVVATDADAAESGLLAAIFPGTFTFTRSGSTSNALIVSFSLSGSAENGVDYRYVSNSVRFNPGQAQTRVDIVPLNDALVESTENVVLTLQEPLCAAIVPPPPGCYTVGPSNHAEVFIRDANSPANQRPYVRLNEPQNGDVFTAPTNIVLRAFAHDQEDGYQLQVEFFDGTNRIGVGEFVATTCPAPFCPYYQFIWSNPSPGNHTLIARATDSQGASSNSAPVNITVQSGDPGTNIVTLIASGSVWKYLDNGTDQGTAWREPGFNDSTWAAGPAQLGYGDGDEATVVSFGPDPSNKYITTYFRRAFNVVNAASFSELRGRLLQDDGAVVYLNGIEVFRNNMPPGPVTHTTLASVGIENLLVSFSASGGLLREGLNVVAVEIHQNSPLSTDISFDLELIGTGDSQPPPPELPIVNVIATDPDAAESGDLAAVFAGTFTFSRTGPVSNALTVFFTLSGSAENGVDYRFISNSVRFNPGQAQARVDVGPLNDDLMEGTENVVLTLQEPACIAIVPPPPGCYRVGPANRAEVFIGDANNLPPYAQLIEPRNGDVFTAPTDIALRAFAHDAEDGENITVEFFANGNSLGFGTYVPAICPDAPCPNYQFIWTDPPIGNHTLIARATDSSGVSSNSAPVTITVQPAEPGTNVTLIAMSSVWKYLDNGSDQGTAWRQPQFDDSAWASGPAQLGYGDGDEATVVSFGPDPINKHITTYFRRAFNVVNAASFSELRGRLLQDDGGVVYLNGVEVFRSNLPPGPIAFNTLAVNNSPDNQIVNFSAPASLLVEGRNVVAVEMHQVNPSSTDLSFDLELIGIGGPPPPPDLPVVNVFATDPDAAESGPLDAIFPGTFTFSRSGPTSNALTAFFTLSGSADNGVDYLYVSNSVRFAPGQSQAHVDIIPLNDDLVEGTENVVLTLEQPGCTAIFPPPPGCYRVGLSDRAEVFIRDANVPPPGTNVTLVASRSIWKYLDNGSDQGTAWRAPAFDDSAWASGQAQLGYGDGDETTVVSFGPDLMNKYITTYFRHAFNVVNAASFSQLRGRLLQDDGGVVYLNGIEIFRSNMPSGPIAFNTLAAGVSPDNQIVEFAAPASLLVEGRNVVAVEMHQVNPSSTDLSFDLELIGTGGPPPPSQQPHVQLNEPRNGDVFTAPANIVLRAYAEDRDDGYNLTVEFFANNQSLGFGTFVPALCPAPYCPYYEFNWSNVPPGNYSLTARATDSSGASSNSSPVNIAVRSDPPPGPQPAPGDQEAPAVAANNEFYLVAWADKRGNDTEWDIYAARITPEGERLDPNGIRICVMRGPQQFPAVASDGRDFLVVWHDARDQYGPTYHDIFGARVTAEGVVLDPNGFPISRAAFDQFGPSVAFNGTHYLVAWYDYRNSDDERLRNDIYGARIGRDGAVIDPAGIAICTAENMQWAPGVAALDGDWFVAWDDSRGQVRGSRVTSGGAVSNPDGLILSQNFSGSAIRVAANASGYLTTWNDSRNYQTTQYDIFARRATVAGQVVGAEFLLCNAPGMQTSPALAAGSGQFLGVWIDDRAGWTDRKIFAARIDADSVLDPNGFQIGSGPASEGWNAVSVGALNGQYLAAWARGFNSDFGQKDIVAVRVTAEGSVLDPTAFLVSTVSTQVVDSDNDGVPDDRDRCQGTAPDAVVDVNGCSLAQLCPCDAPWRTHGEYVNCVIQHSWEFFRAGLITADRRREVIHDAVQSDCGRRPDRRESICIHLFPLTPNECHRDGVQFVLSGDATGSCVLECSEDLVNWRTVEPVAITGWEVTCPMEAGTKARFYRVRAE